MIGKLILAEIDLNDMVNKAEEKGFDGSVVTDPDKAPKVKTLFVNIQIVFLYVVAVGIVLTMIYGAIMYITAGGESEKAEKGKKIITGSIIAAVIAMTSYSFYNFLVGIW